MFKKFADSEKLEPMKRIFHDSESFLASLDVPEEVTAEQVLTDPKAVTDRVLADQAAAPIYVLKT